MHEQKAEQLRLDGNNDNGVNINNTEAFSDDIWTCQDQLMRPIKNKKWH